jgi:bla regulator protein blaR1
MHPSDLLDPLLEATVAGTAAIMVVLVLRPFLRRGFGAGIAYCAWALVPVALFAVLLPAPPVPAAAQAAAAAMPASAATPSVVASVVPPSWPDWVLAAWLAGLLAMLVAAGARQRAFLRGLGRLRRYAHDCWVAESVAGLPALVGLFRPRIVLPGDFEKRFDPRERELVLRHERVHLARGDAAANALAELLHCLFWFNPLLPVALRAFRQDQELACDARVLARCPALRRAYGEAMFKAQLAAQPLPLACHWGFGHPLKERIAMLKAPMVSPRRQRAGLVAVAALALATGFAAWAAQPKRTAPAVVPQGHVHAQLQLRIDEQAPAAPVGVMSRLGEPFAVRIDQDGGDWELQGTIEQAGSGQLRMHSRLLRGGELMADPVLVVREGAPAAISIGQEGAAGFEGLRLDLQLASTDLPRPPAPPVAPKPPVAPAPPAPAPRAPAAPPAPPAAPKVPQAAPAAPPAPPSPPAAPAPPAIPHLPAPRYPAQAVEQKRSGRVMLLVDVGSDGRPTAIEVESANPPGVFEQEAMRAAGQWRFQPAIERGRAVPSKVRVPVDFRMDGPPPAAAPGA